MRKTCRNALCGESMKAYDPLTLLGFCPSCRSALSLGFKGGATVALAVGALIGWWLR